MNLNPELSIYLHSTLTTRLLRNLELQIPKNWTENNWKQVHTLVPLFIVSTVGHDTWKERPYQATASSFMWPETVNQTWQGDQTRRPGSKPVGVTRQNCVHADWSIGRRRQNKSFRKWCRTCLGHRLSSSHAPIHQCVLLSFAVTARIHSYQHSVHRRHDVEVSGWDGRSLFSWTCVECLTLQCLLRASY